MDVLAHGEAAHAPSNVTLTVAVPGQTSQHRRKPEPWAVFRRRRDAEGGGFLIPEHGPGEGQAGRLPLYSSDENSRRTEELKLRWRRED